MNTIHADKTAVVILNWNGIKYLQTFLPAVVANTLRSDVSVVVADNGSTDDSVAWVKQHCPEVDLLQFDKNYGFTGGYNRALKRIKARYFVLLNSDVQVTPGWLEPLEELLDTQPTVAACAPKIKAYHQSSHFEYAGAAGGCLDVFGYPFCYGRILQTIEEDTGQYRHSRDVFWVSGACMAVRAELYERFGGLDEDFFAHMEEIDLCWRFQNAGFRLTYVPQSEVFHVGGGALPNESPRKLFLNYRNNLLMLYKNLSADKLFRIMAGRLLLDGLSALVYLCTGKLSYFAAVWRAHRDFFHRLPAYRLKRQSSQRYQGRLQYSGYYSGSILWAYFVQRIRSAKRLKPGMLG